MEGWLFHTQVSGHVCLADMGNIIVKSLAVNGLDIYMHSHQIIKEGHRQTYAFLNYARI